MTYLQLTTQNSVSTLTLNRPDVRNAFHPKMIAELTSAFLKLDCDPKTRVVILRGAGKSFCAGADLEWMKSMVGFSREQNLRDSDQLFEMFRVAQICSKPVIGVVHGHVMGGGIGLAAICDFVLAESQTKFCFSEVKLGLVPAVISSFVLNRMMPARALQLMLTGEVFSASMAQETGLASFIGTLEQCESEKDRLLQLLLQAGPEAVADTKRLVHFVRAEKDAAAVRAESTQVIADRRVSAEGQEGLKSFLENRKPNWQGTSK